MKLFLYNSGDRYYQRQIAELTNQPIRAVQRETTKLLNIGLIMKHSEGNRIYYGVNKKCPIYNELRMIFIKTTGIAEYLKNEIAGDRINFAFIYGSYADNSENPSSDIDLFVVGDTSSMEISAVISKVKMDMAREINYVIMTLNELKDRLLSG
jgi:predicted nucleotidyltransferase